MPQPVITIYNVDSTAVVPNWNIGEINANSESPSLDITIWNNKGGASAVSDMKDSSITCLDSDGGDVSTLVTGQWMKVLVDTTADLDGGSNKIYSSIGGTTTRPLKAQSLPTGNTILGGINDGVMANSLDNHVKAKLKVAVPVNAPEGLHNFRIRIQGFYT